MARGNLCWVYLLASESAPLYVGLTQDVPHRLAQHRAGSGGRFTRCARDWRVVGAVPVGSRGQARRFERMVKGWSPERKHAFFALFPLATDTDEMRELIDQLKLSESTQRHDMNERRLRATRERMLVTVRGMSPGLINLLGSGGMSDQNVRDWLFQVHPGMGGRPIDALVMQGTEQTLAATLRHLVGIAHEPAPTYMTGRLIRERRLSE